MMIAWKTPLMAVLAVPILGAMSPSGCGSGSQSQAGSSPDQAMPGAADTGPLTLKARLNSFKEAPPNVTTGHGLFTAEVSADGKSITYELTYDALEGNASGGAVTGAHIHIGHPNVAGGIAIPLCGSAMSPCPASPADLKGTLTSADVTGPSAQGVAAGDLAKVIEAIRRRVTFVNVHTTAFPSGEIRGQIAVVRMGGEDDPD